MIPCVFVGDGRADPGRQGFRGNADKDMSPGMATRHVWRRAPRRLSPHFLFQLSAQGRKPLPHGRGSESQFSAFCPARAPFAWRLPVCIVAGGVRFFGSFGGRGWMQVLEKMECKFFYFCVTGRAGFWMLGLKAQVMAGKDGCPTWSNAGSPGRGWKPAVKLTSTRPVCLFEERLCRSGISTAPLRARLC